MGLMRTQHWLDLIFNSQTAERQLDEDKSRGEAPQQRVCLDFNKSSEGVLC